MDREECEAQWVSICQEQYDLDRSKADAPSRKEERQAAIAERIDALAKAAGVRPVDVRGDVSGAVMKMWLIDRESGYPGNPEVPAVPKWLVSAAEQQVWANEL